MKKKEEVFFFYNGILGKRDILFQVIRCPQWGDSGSIRLQSHLTTTLAAVVRITWGDTRGDNVTAAVRWRGEGKAPASPRLSLH